MAKEEKISRREVLKAGTGIAALTGAGILVASTREETKPDTQSEDRNDIQSSGDTLYLQPGTEIDGAINELDGGKIVLQKGTHRIGRQVRIPGNVVVEGQGIESVIRPQSDTDMFLVGGDFPAERGNATALRNLSIDTRNVPDYTSTAVKFTDAETYQGGIEFLQNIVFHMRNNGERGTAISLVDETGSGLGSVTFGNVRIIGPDVALRLEVNNGGWVNANSGRNVWAKVPRIGIQEVVNEGVIRSNVWDFRVNGEPKVERVLMNRGDRNRYRLLLFDLGRIDGPALTVAGNQNVLHTEGGVPDLWRWVVDTGIANEYKDQSKTVSFLPQEELPYWLETRGEGRLIGRTDEARLVAGSSTGDEFAVSSQEGWFSAWQFPWLELWFDFDDSLPGGFAQLGFEFSGEDAGGAYLCADPHDALGTGVTDEFLTQFDVGTDRSVERAGAPLDRDSHSLGLRMLQGESQGAFNLLWVLDGEQVRFERDLDEHTLNPRFSIRKTGNSTAVVHLEELVELRCARPT